MNETGDSITVPPADSPYFPKIVNFALTYNGYDRHGGLEGASRIGKKVN